MDDPIFRSRSRRIGGTLAWLACLLLILSSELCAQEGAGSEPEPSVKRTIRVVCLFPLSGRSGRTGRDCEDATRLAVEDVNARWKDSEWELVVEISNTHSDATEAVEIAERKLSDDENPVHFLCGVVTSSVGVAVSELAYRTNTIFIGTLHGSSRLTLEYCHRYYFRVTNSTYQSMAAGALYLENLRKKQEENGKKPWRTLAFIGPDYEYGRAMLGDLRESLNRLEVDYEMVGEYWPALFEPDFSAYVSAIREAKPDVLVSAHWGGDLIEFIRRGNDAKLFDTDMIFCNFDAGGNYEVMERLGAEMPDGLVLSSRHHVNWPETKENRDFVQKFKDATGRFPGHGAEGAYAGILAIEAAINKAGDPNDDEALIAALENLRFKLPEDPDGFESYMDPQTHQIVQRHAIGETISNSDYPPAVKMLGNWEVYEALDLFPTKEVIEARLNPIRRKEWEDQQRSGGGD